MKTHYELLGVERSATQSEIREAYLELARKNHPDSAKKPDAERFKAIAEAYSAIKEPKRRAEYEAFLKLAFEQCPACDGFGRRFKQKGFTERVPFRCTACKGSGLAAQRVRR